MVMVDLRRGKKEESVDWDHDARNTARSSKENYFD